MKRAAINVCIERIVPEELAEMLPRKHVSGLPFPVRFRHDFAPRDIRLAVPVRKRWPNGYELTCCFLDGSDLQRRKVEEYARIWEQHANIQLRFVAAGSAEIRISFRATRGSWSALGTDALNQTLFPASQATMNFGWLHAATPEVEWRRVVLHEFGHALGAIHEHQQPASPLPWNEKVVYEVFSGPPNNWSRQQIERNILKKYATEQMNWTEFDPDSIMLYHFPERLFLRGAGTKLNTDLSAMDKRLMSELYPHRRSVDS